MKGIVLVENTAPEGSGLQPEHGLSLYLEYGGRKLLLDAGASGRFADNAERLGVDLASVELAVLSHGHYDHAGGLARFFQLNPSAPVYFRRGAEGDYFARDPGGLRFIGIPQEVQRAGGSRLRPVDGLHLLFPGAWLVPCTVRDAEFVCQADNLLRRDGAGELVPDDYRHEQSLVLEEDGELIVFSSCSHNGMVNIVRSVLDQLPGKRVRAAVGGLHMFSRTAASGMNCTPEYIAAVADALRGLGVEELCTGHCTGDPALELLRERFGPGCHALTTGQVLEL